MTIKLAEIEYVTLYTGNNGSSYCTCKCPCCSQKGRDRHYQGNLTQALEMFNLLPNMKQLYLFGNPDITVDTDFCHDIINEAVKRGIRVCCSTSGVGGKTVLSRLLKGVPTEMVDYISFSFDGTTQEEMSFLKGINYPMKSALQGLEWAMENGYQVKVQPTLWSCNYTKVGKIIEYFCSKGVRWFTFHIGSLEAEVDLVSHQHLTPEQIKNVHEQISKVVQENNNIKVRCPIIYTQCGTNDSTKWYCMNPERVKELLVIFTEDGIRATHTPMASLFNEDLLFNLSEKETINIPKMMCSDVCPFSSQLSGRNDTCCRYISRYY